MPVKTKDNYELSPADICRENGWIVGTRLIGDEGYGPETIEIMAIGESQILCKWTWANGKTEESSTTLACREWSKI
jgi:hypothetical protein